MIVLLLRAEVLVYVAALLFRFGKLLIGGGGWRGLFQGLDGRGGDRARWPGTRDHLAGALVRVQLMELKYMLGLFEQRAIVDQRDERLI